MRTFFFKAHAILILTLFAVHCVNAGSIRCGVHLISDGGRHGPGKYEVLKKCGDPTFRQGNTWVYDKGDSRSKKIIHFNDSGILTRIE